MAKYSILMFGKNKVIINDFFMYHDERLEILSASNRSEDLTNHLKYYEPDALVYCMQEEDQDDMQQIVVVRTTQRMNIPLIIIGQSWECEEFERYTNHEADYEVQRPISIYQAQDKIVTYLGAHKRVKAKEQAKKEEEERIQREVAERAKMAENAGRRHILVIDDDPIMLKVMKEYLRDEYEVATAISGKVAMKYLSSKTVDLIFLDYLMPDESGPEVLEQLSQNDFTRDIPVIFLTGVKDKDKIQKALALKPSGYLLKPIEREKLLEILAKQFSPQ